MRATIVFHSVCGNDFLIGRMFQQALKQHGHEVRLLRVPDADFAVWRDRFPAAAEYAAEMLECPEATADDLLEAELLILGAPTYFGNMSGEMKLFLDSTGRYYLTQPLKGGKALFFTSSASPGGGGGFTLDTLIRFAQHHGILPLPVPVAIQQQAPEMSAYGLTHISGPLGDRRPDEALRYAIESLVQYYTGR